MRFYPLGYPIDIVTSSDPVLKAASMSWDAGAALFNKRSIPFKIEVHRSTAPQTIPQFEAPPGRLTFAGDEDNFAAFDLQSRSGHMLVSESALSEPGAFRRHWLEALVLTALDSVFFTPLHAACVAREGAGALLCGDSGAGKGSLPYACARRGWTFVPDDAVHLPPNPGGIGVGGSNLIHLREPARALFPELA